MSEAVRPTLLAVAERIRDDCAAPRDAMEPALVTALLAAVVVLLAAADDNISIIVIELWSISSDSNLLTNLATTSSR